MVEGLSVVPVSGSEVEGPVLPVLPVKPLVGELSSVSLSLPPPLPSFAELEDPHAAVRRSIQARIVVVRVMFEGCEHSTGGPSARACETKREAISHHLGCVA